jgi:hypothetical protein
VAVMAPGQQGGIKISAGFSQKVWGLCGENCRKSAKVWKISQNVENSDLMISVT